MFRREKMPSLSKVQRSEEDIAFKDIVMKASTRKVTQYNFPVQI